MNVSRLQLLGILGILNVFWAPVNFFVPFALTSFEVGTFLSLRWGLFSLLLWALIAVPSFRKATGYIAPSNRGKGIAFLMGFLFQAPAHIFFTQGLAMSTASETTVLNLAAPLVVAGLSVLFLSERPTPRLYASIFVVLLGSYWVALGFSAPHLSTENARGNLMYLLGVLCESFAVVGATRVVRASSGLGALSWEVTGAGLGQMLAPFLFGSVISHGFTGPLQVSSVLAVAYLVIFPSVLAWGVWYAIAERVPLSFMMVGLGLQGPLAAALGYFWKHERWALATWVGLGAILVGLGIAATDRTKLPTHSDPV